MNPLSAQRWFFLCLMVVIVLSLPALALAILCLAGQDAELNEWLQENFQVSFSLVLPPVWTILLLLVPPLIILLYFLKLKRKPLQVPSTFLWKKTIEDLHVNSLFQWIRQNILLLLQLLVLVVFLYSLLGFRYHGSSSRGRHYILLIDNSASMSAKDVEPSRLEWAKHQALKEIDAAGDNDFGMVIVFNSKATTLQGYTNNRAKLRDAIGSIEPTQRPTRIEEALSLAESLANPVRSTEQAAVQPDDVPPEQERTLVPAKGIEARVHLYSDGRFAPLSESALANLASRQAGNVSALGNLNLKYHRAGKPGPEHANNVGIVSLNAIRYNPGPLAKIENLDVAKLQVLVRVQNFRAQPTQARLRLDVLQNGKLVHPEQRLLQLPARKITKKDPETEAEEKDIPGERSIAFILPPFDLRENLVLYAHLENTGDHLPLDDEAWLAISSVRKAKVLIVGPSNAILDAFFDQEATRRIATVEKLAATDLKVEAYLKRARGADVDLVIFDRCRPEDEADMPQANTIFIDDVPPPWQRSQEAVKNPFLLVSKKDHPLLRYITTLYDVGMSEAFYFHPDKHLDPKLKPQFEVAEDDKNRRAMLPVTRILEAGGGVPMLLAIARGSYTDVVLTFPLINRKAELTTNWPLQPSFPLFFRNALYMLGNVDDAVRVLSVQPGEPMVLRPEAGVHKLTVHTPQGERARLERGSRPDFVFADTDQVGVYKLERDDQAQRFFTVNLLDSGESNLEPRDEIAIGSESIAAGVDRPTPRDLWKWILVGAMLLLLAEWYVYNRRVAL
jgi:hypothetical protein